MGRWEELLKMDPDRQVQVNELYSEKFPRDIRQCLSKWIESQDWDSAVADAEKAKACFQDLLGFLDQQLNESVSRKTVLERPNYEWFKHYLQKHFGGQPQKLAALLSECLSEEDRILGASRDEHPPVQMNPLDQQVEDLKIHTLEVQKELKSWKDLQEKFIYVQRNWQHQVDPRNGMAPSEQVMKEELWKLASYITQTEEKVLKHMRDILLQCDKVAVTLIDVELPQWKRRQHMACVGCPIDTSLDHLQRWFTGVVEVLIEVQTLLGKLQAEKQDNTQASNLSKSVAEIQTFNVSLLTKVLSNALVVEKQPSSSKFPHRPLILKTKVRFSMSVRFLANLPQFKCALKVQSVFDKDVEEAMKYKGFRHFEFTVNGSKVLDTDAPDGGLVAMFGLMSIEEVPASKVQTKKKRLEVPEELHIIKFVSDFQLGGLKFGIETTTLPLVVVTNTNQIPSAWVTIMWCSMLPPADLENLYLFAKPPQVPWSQLSQVLSWQFNKVGQLGLNPDQLSMLHARIAGEAQMVKLAQFKREPAWTWLDRILSLIKKRLVHLWSKGLIMGFVTRERTRLLLMEKPTGTFLLRFSESIMEGAISISYVEHPNTGGTGEVTDVDPYRDFELETQNFSNVIYDYSVTDSLDQTKHPLVYLYPDIPKDAVFKCFYKDSGESLTADGYARRKNVPQTRRSPPPPLLPPDGLEMEIDPNSPDLMEDFHSLLGPELWFSLERMPFSDDTSTLTAQDLNNFVPV